MECSQIIQKLLLSAMAGGLVYMIGMLIVFPYSPICRILEKKYDYDDILYKNNIVSIVAWIITAVVVFFYLL